MQSLLLAHQFTAITSLNCNDNYEKSKLKCKTWRKMAIKSKLIKHLNKQLLTFFDIGKIPGGSGDHVSRIKATLLSIKGTVYLITVKCAFIPSFTDLDIKPDKPYTGNDHNISFKLTVRSCITCIFTLQRFEILKY